MSCGCNKMVGGSLASDMVMANVQGQQDQPYDFVPSSASCVDTAAYKGVNQTAGSYAKSMIKRHKKMMRKSKSKKSKRQTKKVVRRSKSKKHSMRRHTKSRRSMRGGGSDWAMSQYSQGPLNDNSDLSGYFSSSAPSSKGFLRNPPNLASAGSGAPMDFFGSGAPL